MTTYQPSIFFEGSSKYYYLEYSLDLSQPTSTIKSAIKEAYVSNPKDVHTVVAFGKNLWNMLSPTSNPKELREFEEIQGIKNFKIPSTQRDLFFWVHSENHDANFDMVLHIQKALESIGKLELDLNGFTYHDSRDLIGFVDGSANPKDDLRQQAAIIPEGEEGAGGSYVLTQKWVHNLDAFKALPIDKQEKVIGRTKKDSIELEGDDMPPDSHVSRTDVKVGGKAMKIYRRSAPYGSATEHGLYFLSFACEIERFDIQLKRMYGLSEDGLHDKILIFSTPVTSSYWFAPSQDDLDKALS